MSPQTAWFQSARWGCFFHYLAAPASSREDCPLTSDDWNRRVESFDTESFASQVAQSGAGYVVLTLGQNSGFYCSPNATYDKITGITPSKCSQRDLLADVADALTKYNIKTLAYLPSHA